MTKVESDLKARSTPERESSALQRVILPLSAMLGLGIGSIAWLRSERSDSFEREVAAKPIDSEANLPLPELSPCLDAAAFGDRSSLAISQEHKEELQSLKAEEIAIGSLELFNRYDNILQSKITDSPEQVAFFRARAFQYRSLLSFDEIESLKEILKAEDLSKSQFDGLLTGMYRRLIEFSQEQGQEGALFERLVQAYRRERIGEDGDQSLAAFYARLINLHVGLGSLTRQELQPLDALMIESAQRTDVNNGWLLPGLLSADRQFPGVIATIHEPRDLALYVKDNHYSLPPSSFEYYKTWAQYGGTPQQWFDEVGAAAIRSGFSKTADGYQPPLSAEQYQQKLDFITVLPLIIQSGEISGESIVNAFPPELFSKFNYSYIDEQGNQRGARIDLSVSMAQFIGAYGGQAGAAFLQKLEANPNITEALRFECRSSRVLNGTMNAQELSAALEQEQNPIQIAEFLLAQAQYDPAARQHLSKIIENPELDINLRVQALMLAGEYGACRAAIEQALRDREPAFRYFALLAYCSAGQSDPDRLKQFVVYDSTASHYAAIASLINPDSIKDLENITGLITDPKVSELIREDVLLVLAVHAPTVVNSLLTKPPFIDNKIELSTEFRSELALALSEPNKAAEQFVARWKAQLKNDHARLSDLNSSASRAVLAKENTLQKRIRP